MFDFWRWARIDWSGGLDTPPTEACQPLEATRPVPTRVRAAPEPIHAAKMTSRGFVWSDLKAEMDLEHGGKAAEQPVIR